jgi:hypothetical protein
VTYDWFNNKITLYWTRNYYWEHSFQFE